MQIDDIKVILVRQQNGLIGFASFVLSQTFYVSGIAIHKRLDGSGYRLTYPTRKSGEQSYNLCHPITQEASKAIEVAVYQKLKDVINQDCSHVGYDCHKHTA